MSLYQFSNLHAAESGHVRLPLPSQEEIAALPKDGGEEFNRLIFTQSPYLLQHARNPVDWYPWGEEAFAAAAEQGKPVFLSVGYTTCHWCHVMEHESFEDEEVAAELNKNYICVKVDREERPDIDEVYMTVTQAMTGRGGWPMTVIMTPDKKPFFAGTYLPKNDRTGQMGLMRLLSVIATDWVDKKSEIVETAENVASQLQEMVVPPPVADDATVAPEVLSEFATGLMSTYDATNAGFGNAPKFPVPPNLLALLRYHQRTGDADALRMVEETLQAMRLGGVYDQVGHGIHRYSTDKIWLLPHFEKMLYDQALSVMAYVEAYQVTKDESYAEVAREILDYVLRDMTAENGGFYSAEDADSEGEEGKFYVWTIEEVTEILGEDDGAFYTEKFQFTEEGTFTDEASGGKNGTNIPHLAEPLTSEEKAKLEPLRQKLFAAREKRVHPQKDDKILTDWNGLMIAAFAKAGVALNEPRYVEAAQKAADFIMSDLTDENGRLLKRSRNGEAGLTAHLEDYMFFTWGLLDLYEATFDVTYLAEAVRLADETILHFADDDAGGFFMTADDAEQLLVRTKKLYGGAIPAGNAVAMLNYARLYRMTGKTAYSDTTDSLVRAFSGQIEQSPGVFPVVMMGLDFIFGPSKEIVIAGDPESDDTNAMLEALREPYQPNQVVMLRPNEGWESLVEIASFTETQVSQNGKATAYVCENFACNQPTTDLAEMMKFLSK